MLIEQEPSVQWLYAQAHALASLGVRPRPQCLLPSGLMAAADQSSSVLVSGVIGVLAASARISSGFGFRAGCGAG
jgi:hypothetical protein